MDQESKNILTLSLVPGLGGELIRRCIEQFGSAQAVLDASAGQFASVAGIGQAGAQRIVGGIEQVLTQDQVSRELALMEEHQTRLIVQGSPTYPALLGHIPDPPILLYVRGEIRREDAVALAIVGARRCSAYGREQAGRFASAAAGAGLCVVSGGAYGIDAAAHQAAINARGRTLVVLGSGIANPYPQSHARLFDQVADGQGAVVSELPMGTAPMPGNFPKRNRIISGLSLGVLVVEASNRSGALITARLAVEEHSREVMAVPGRVDSAASVGCHRIIREGWATLVTNIADVLDALGETGSLLKVGIGRDDEPDEPTTLAKVTFTESQAKIIDALGEPRELNELAALTGLPVPAVQADLTLLHIRGYIARQGTRIVRTPGTPGSHGANDDLAK